MIADDRYLICAPLSLATFLARPSAASRLNTKEDISSSLSRTFPVNTNEICDRMDGPIGRLTGFTTEQTVKVVAVHLNIARDRICSAYCHGRLRRSIACLLANFFDSFENAKTLLQ